MYNCKIGRSINWPLPVSSHPHLIGLFVRDAMKGQPGLIICDDVAKVFVSICFKHVEQVLLAPNSLFVLLAF